MREALITTIIMAASILGIIMCYGLQVAKAEMKRKKEWRPYEDPEYRKHIGL